MVERRTLLARNLLAAILFAGTSALAHPSYPGSIQTFLNVPCDISSEAHKRCTLCHATNVGGPGNLRIPGMGKNLEDNCELSGSNPDMLIPALQCAEANNQDTDGDLIPDIQELRDGTDPNVAGASVCGGAANDPPKYGCFARVASRGPVDGVAGAGALATLLIGAALLRRRAR